MATEFISTINKTGQDYDTLALWEAAIQSDFTSAQTRVYAVSSVTGTVADGATVVGQTNSYTATVRHCNVSGTSPRQVLVYHDTGAETFANNEQLQVDVDNYITLTATAGDNDDTAIAVAHCYDDDGEMSSASAITIDGSTADGTNYIKITAPSGERHDGKKYGTGARIKNTGQYTRTINLSDTYTILEWLGISHDTASVGNVSAVNVTVDYCTVRNCIITQPQAGAFSGITAGGLIGYILNNIIYDIANANGIGISNYSTPTYYIYNNTIFNVGSATASDGISIADDTNNCVVKNNLVITVGAGKVCYDVGNATVATNGSSDATGSVGLQNLTSAEFVEDDDGSEDLHLATGATSIGAGTDLGTTYGVNIDIDGRDRDAEGDTWDIGADEYVATTTAIPQPALLTCNTGFWGC